MNFILKKMNKKGFSLIELIVVIAILAIIAAVAIPRFAGIQDRSEVKADGASASEIIGAARVYAADEDFNLTTWDNTSATLSFDIEDLITEGYLSAGSSDAQSDSAAGVPATPDFTLDYVGGVFTVAWSPDNTITKAQLVTENVKWIMLKND